VEHKIRYCEEYWLWGTIDFLSMGKKIQWNSIVYHNCLVTTILQNIFFYAAHKEIHTHLEHLEGE